MGGLRGLQLLEGGCSKRGGQLFSGGVAILQKINNKIKSEIFNDKKFYTQKYCSLS